MTKLEKLYDRYGKKISHHGDCRIYCLVEHGKFCSCGLLHDLEPLDDEIIQEIYPKFYDEILVQYGKSELREKHE